MPIRVCYAYHIPIRVPPETRTRSNPHLFHSYAYDIHHTRTTSRDMRITRVWRVPAPKLPLPSHSIRVLPSAIRVPAHLIRVLPSAIRVCPETRFPDLLWLSLLRDLSNSTFYSPILHNNRSYHLTRIITYSISQLLTLLHLIPTNFLSIVTQFRSSKEFTISS